MSAQSQSAASSPIQLNLSARPTPRVHPVLKRILQAGIIAALALVVAVLVWQGITAHGNPAPDKVAKISPTAAIIDTGILVFREGLEAILVLAALTASLTRTQEGYWKPVALGAGASFLASVATWFIVVALISEINAPALQVQAGTGLLAVIVLLVIMNWFFHKIYWTGWITHHNRRKRNLLEGQNRSQKAMFGGLMLIGFTSVYREGFEVVLFLQSLRIQVGGHIIFCGVLIGLGLTSIVAVLTFVAHYKLPYKRMLVLTGIMIGTVLLVMVGEEIFELQQAGWMTAHTVMNGHITSLTADQITDPNWSWSDPSLTFPMPDWLNVWFSIYPTIESLLAQVLAAVFVIGSYFLARRVCRNRPQLRDVQVMPQCIVPDCANCEISHNQPSQS